MNTIIHTVLLGWRERCERVLELPPYWGWDVSPEWADGYYCVIWCAAEKGMGVVGVKPLLGLKTNTVTRTPTTVAEHRETILIERFKNPPGTVCTESGTGI